MGTGYWPNIEGFFTTFPNGLGFLAQDEQIWVAGTLGAALRADARYQDFLSVNDARLRTWGYLADTDKASFFAPASCVIVPVHIGAGAKIKTADALASGCPVITTSHAIEGYGPLVEDALGRGVYVADSPYAFRDLVRRALREGLPGCVAEVRSRVSLERMAATLAPLYAGLLKPT
jgi:glycosyltransferase involved in cell wall biosynthesis